MGNNMTSFLDLCCCGLGGLLLLMFLMVPQAKPTSEDHGMPQKIYVRCCFPVQQSEFSPTETVPSYYFFTLFHTNDIQFFSDFGKDIVFDSRKLAAKLGGKTALNKIKDGPVSLEERISDEHNCTLTFSLNNAGHPQKLNEFNISIEYPISNDELLDGKECAVLIDALVNCPIVTKKGIDEDINKFKVLWCEKSIYRVYSVSMNSATTTRLFPDIKRLSVSDNIYKQLPKKDSDEYFAELALFQDKVSVNSQISRFAAMSCTEYNRKSYFSFARCLDIPCDYTCVSQTIPEKLKSNLKPDLRPIGPAKEKNFLLQHVAIFRFQRDSGGQIAPVCMFFGPSAHLQIRGNRISYNPAPTSLPAPQPAPSP